MDTGTNTYGGKTIRRPGRTPSTSNGMPGAARSWVRGLEHILPSQASERCSSKDSLISDLQPPELGDNTILLLAQVMAALGLTTVP